MSLSYRRYLPSPEQLRERAGLRYLWRWLDKPQLWQFNRRSVSGAVFWGVALAFFPLPIQTLLVAVIAILLHVNLPLAIALVWLCNPFTIIPMLYGSYLLGAWLLGYPFDPQIHFSSAWMQAHLAPVVTGLLVAGLGSGGLSFLLVRLLWRWHVMRKWRQRKERRREP